MTEEFSQAAAVHAILSDLIDGWCERRALMPLRYVLPVYPFAVSLTDEWQQLYTALEDVEALCRDHLDTDERQNLNQALVLIGEILDVDK